MIKNKLWKITYCFDQFTSKEKYIILAARTEPEAVKLFYKLPGYSVARIIGICNYELSKTND